MMVLSVGRYVKQVFMTIIIHQTVLSYLAETENERTMIGDDILLRFRGPINAH
jgi:hypothetical protein